MIKVRKLAEISDEDLARLIRRAEQDITSLLPTAQEIIQHVQAEGDKALTHYTKQFDAPAFTPEMLRIPAADFEAAATTLPENVRAAIDQAHANIQRFHAYRARGIAID